MQASSDVIIQVPDLTAAMAFYEGVIGLRVFERSRSLVGLDAGGFRLFVEPGSAPGPVFEFLAVDTAETRSRLLSAGCLIVDEDPSVPRCYFKDPFGLTFNVRQKA